ncbi:MAG: histidine triad nucleotide-binding protein [Acidobacteriota bacterium]
MSDCIFCKIVTGQIPCRKVYEDEHVLSFQDLNPQAPTHLLVIPKQHVEKFSDLGGQKELLGNLMLAVGKIAADQKLVDYRLVINNGAVAGQSVFHLHVHVLGGRAMNWPPG